MTLFDRPSWVNHDAVHLFHDEGTGLRAIVAIHDTLLGPALGGCRMWAYDSEEDALRDALRLSRGMTFKAACAGLDLGGGKAVILGPAPDDPARREALFQKFGEAVESLGGRYITAEDVGTSVADMAQVRRGTTHVTGLPVELGGSGDPSPFTAHGVFLGIRAAVAHAFGGGLDGLRVAVQGIGHVGVHLVRELVEAGADVAVADIDRDAVESAATEWGVRAVDPDAIYDEPMDVFAPCALGGVVNDETVGRLSCKVVAGAANNQLLEDRHAQVLNDRGVLYAPDFVINAGGLINVSEEMKGWNEQVVTIKLEGIAKMLTAIFEKAAGEPDLNTLDASDMIARERLEAAARAKGSRKSAW